MTETGKALRDPASKFWSRGTCLGHLVCPQGFRVLTVQPFQPQNKRYSGSGSRSLSGWALWGREGRRSGAFRPDRAGASGTEAPLSTPTWDAWCGLWAIWRVWPTFRRHWWPRGAGVCPVQGPGPQSARVPSTPLPASETPSRAQGIHFCQCEPGVETDARSADTLWALVGALAPEVGLPGRGRARPREHELQEPGQAGPGQVPTNPWDGHARSVDNSVRRLRASRSVSPRPDLRGWPGWASEDRRGRGRWVCPAARACPASVPLGGRDAQLCPSGGILALEEF